MHFQVNVYCMGGRQGELILAGGKERRGREGKGRKKMPKEKARLYFLCLN